MYALTETNFMARVNPETLEIMSRIDITDYLASASTTFAHPHVVSSNETGQVTSWITMGMNTKSPRWYYEFIKYEAQGDDSSSSSLECCSKPTVLASLPSSHAFGLSYFHSFALTENYIVFLEQALVFDMLRMISVIVLNKPFSDALLMKKTFDTRIHLIDRKTGWYCLDLKAVNRNSFSNDLPRIVLFLFIKMTWITWHAFKNKKNLSD